MTKVKVGMLLSDIYQTFQSNSGDSGTGRSFYENAADCGRRARLQQENKNNESMGQTDGNPLAIGTAYHLFHHVACVGDSSTLILDMTDGTVSLDFLEGLRLFRGWQSLWGSMEEKYGRVVGTELQVATEFNGQPYTGRLDAVVEISDIAAFYAKTALLLPEPGIYVVDHKSAKGDSDSHAYAFTMGNQGKGYLHMYPEAKGMIFDVLKKVQVFRHEPKLSSTGKVLAGKSYSHYLQMRQWDDAKVINQLVQLGSINYQENIANPSACLRGFQPCPFLLKGMCNGY